MRDTLTWAFSLVFVAWTMKDFACSVVLSETFYLPMGSVLGLQHLWQQVWDTNCSNLVIWPSYECCS